MNQMKWSLFGDGESGLLKSNLRGVWANFVSTELHFLNKVLGLFSYESEQQNHSQVAR